MLPNFLKNTIDERVKQFTLKRSKVNKEVTLTQKRIYIFLSKEGFLYGMLLLITFIAGVNYANNLILGMCFYLASILVICIHFTYAQLSGLHIKMLDIADAECGDLVRVRLQISATGSKPHRQILLEFQNEVVSSPMSKTETNTETEKETQFDATNIKRKELLASVLEQTIVSFYLPATRRGQFVLPRLTISSVYPLGVLKTWTYILFHNHAWVWPNKLSFPSYGSDTAKAHSESNITGQKKGSDEFDKLDTYQLGESLARVSWKHLASGKGMITKHFADPMGKDVILDYHNMPASHHENKLRQLSYAVQALSKTNTPFALKTPFGALTLNTGDIHLAQCLLILAKAPIMNDNQDGGV